MTSIKHRNWKKIDKTQISKAQVNLCWPLHLGLQSVTYQVETPCTRKIQTDKNKTFVMIHEGCAELSHFQVHCISIRARSIFEFQVGYSNYKRSVNFKMSFWCHRFDQKTNNFFLRISALASKKRSNQKNKDTLLY